MDDRQAIIDLHQRYLDGYEDVLGRLRAEYETCEDGLRLLEIIELIIAYRGLIRICADMKAVWEP